MGFDGSLVRGVFGFLKGFALSQSGTLFRFSLDCGSPATGDHEKLLHFEEYLIV